ncbi:hypothetical protein AAFF_G00210200 [Aldrovandia affinis]|uniref:Gypsy retrotransposon integrase-like protein 1 n=1 Tax=Aldrovandia affinis TaxID=143900 RepID=A0AAD7WVP0_9TELE|nr:hypothetical protein AAFF_G00210200 [Aldrovandia affinis]
MDASNVDVCAVLSQPSDSGEQVIAYYSHALSKTERNYCVTRRELLAAIAALRHLRPYLHGARFLVQTDHASLTGLLNFKNPAGQLATRRSHMCRVGWRPEWADVATLDTETRAYHSQWASLEARDGVLYWRWRAPGRGADLLQLLVPRTLRTQVLQLVHGATGPNKTLHRLRGRFCWPGCRHARPFAAVLYGASWCVDILGPYPVTDSGNRYVLVAMDYFTKWPEAYAMPDQIANTMVGRLVEEMFCRFGAPAELHSNQGRNFESRVFGEVWFYTKTGWPRINPWHRLLPKRQVSHPDPFPPRDSQCTWGRPEVNPAAAARTATFN